MDARGPVHDGKTAIAASEYKEIHRVSICPASAKYGIQIPLMAWHTVEVKEPSVIFEAKDGPYKG